MATSVVSKTAAKGGSFLLESAAPLDVFTPADLTDDQKLIGQTAEEFVLKEVLPLAKDLENKKPGLMAELIRKGGELGLMGGGAWTRLLPLFSPKSFPSMEDLPSPMEPTRASGRCPSSISAPKRKNKNIFPSWLPRN